MDSEAAKPSVVRGLAHRLLACCRPLVLGVAAIVLLRPTVTLASGAALSLGPSAPLTRQALIGRFVMWSVMFGTAALLAGALRA